MKNKINLLRIVLGLATLAFVLIGFASTMIVLHGHPKIMWENAVYVSLIMAYLIIILAINTAINGFGLLTNIDRNELISANSLIKLHRITRNLMLITIFSVGFLPMFYNFTQQSDAPGVMGIGFFIFGLALGFYSLFQVLEGLMKNKMESKKM